MSHAQRAERSSSYGRRVGPSVAAMIAAPALLLAATALLVILAVAAGSSAVGQESAEPPKTEEAPVPEAPTAEVPAPEAPEAPTPEAPEPAEMAPEAPTPETPAAETPAAETPAAETPAPETPTPEAPQPEAMEADEPSPSPSDVPPPPTAQPPTEAVPETPAADAVEKSSCCVPSCVPCCRCRCRCCCRRLRLRSRRCCCPCPSRCGASAGVTKADPHAWRDIFDGKTLAGWKVAEFGGDGKVYVKDGMIVMEMGGMMSGVTYTAELPRDDYELTLEGMRLEGGDFFCTTTFPVGKDPCTLVVGGWGGSVVGLSNVDYYDASDNPTTKFKDFKDNTWYKIRLRVSEAKIEAWIDGEKFVNQPREGHKFGIRFEVEPCVPLGISTWSTSGAVRNIKLRKLTPEEIQVAKEEVEEEQNPNWSR